MCSSIGIWNEDILTDMYFSWQLFRFSIRSSELMSGFISDANRLLGGRDPSVLFFHTTGPPLIVTQDWSSDDSVMESSGFKSSIATSASALMPRCPFIVDMPKIVAGTTRV